MSTTTTATAEKTKLIRYRIIAGTISLGKGKSKELPNRRAKHYACRDRAGNLRKNDSGETLPDVIETDKKLDKLFGRHKFIRLHAPIEDGLSKLSVKELIEYAEGEEMELNGATKKEDIISRIRIATG